MPGTAALAAAADPRFHRAPFPVELQRDTATHDVLCNWLAGHLFFAERAGTRETIEPFLRLQVSVDDFPEVLKIFDVIRAQYLGVNSGLTFGSLVVEVDEMLNSLELRRWIFQGPGIVRTRS